jgi:hypothetical protein
MALAGTSVGVFAGYAAAQPTVVNVSGATLLETFLRSRASTIDFIDVDGDGVARVNGGFQVDQLAPFVVPSPFPGNQTWPSATPANMQWVLLYNAVGSTNGFQELIDFGRTFTTQPGTNTVASQSLRISARTAAFYNRSRFINAGAATQDNTGANPNPEVPEDLGPLFNSNNPGGAPVRAITTAGPLQFRALYTSSAVASTSPNEGLTQTGGMSVDVSPLDVPTSWAVIQTGAQASTRKPLTAGYGGNAGNPTDLDGARRNTGSRQTTLATLTGGANLFNPSVTPDANTIFDTLVLIAPVAPVINFGIGNNLFDQADIRHIFTTGRQRDGENLVAVTRDSGSGTRNAFDNSNGIDPSWNNGENVGVRNNGVQFDRLGPVYIPSNKQGNNRVEGSVIQNRLAMGYVGPERGFESQSGADSAFLTSWLTTGKMEIASVRNSLYGGTQFVRPTLDNLLDNGPNGWVIWGPGTLASFGDPRSAPASKGGLGWNNTETRPATLNPAMRNVEAAAYINNISRSVAAFTALPGSDQTIFTPGEFAATQYILLGATDFLKQSTPTIDPTVLVPNPGLNQSLQDFIRFQSGNILGNPAYAAFGNSVAPVNSVNSRAGKVPLRSTYAQNDARTVAQGGTTSTAAFGTLFAPANAFGDSLRLFVTNFRYSDVGLVPNGDAYITQGGTTLAYGANLPLRNAVAGDFNADGVRNATDIAQMIAAWRQRNGGPVWTSPNATGALATLASTTGQAANAADAVIEILGDFNGDGSFTRLDVRYFADGLAMVTDASVPDTGRRLDRKVGFTNVDSAFGGNFFGTALATPKTYANGDARGDVYNRSGRVSPGHIPVGADSGNSADGLPVGEANRVDGWDISYVQAQFLRNNAVTDGTLNWNTLTEATGLVTVATATGTQTTRADLSADMTGDGRVNQADVVELVQVILGTTLGDVNLDGVTNAADLAIVDASIATAPAQIWWGTGDLTGDGVVNAADRTIVTNIFNACSSRANVAGANQSTTPDATLTADDIIVFLGWYFGSTTGSPVAGNPASPANLLADVSGANQNSSQPDGALTADDIIVFLGFYFAGCP